MPRNLLIVLLMLVAPLAACSGAQIDKGNAANEAEQIYIDGVEHLHGGSLLEAEQEFQRLLKMPSYLQLTALARLRLADAQFHEHKYDEAIETYLSFVQRHDSNPNVPYALFMVAKAHFELAPSELWILPPIEELDLSAVQQARTHLERFVKQYPRSRFVTEATALRDRCLDLQYAHAQYVAKFYAGRKRWTGVVFRLHQAMQQFPNRAQTLENFGLLAQAYEELAWRTRAQELWRALARRWPESNEARQAPDHVARLQAQIDEAKRKGDASAEMPAELPPMAAVKPEQLDPLIDEG